MRTENSWGKNSDPRDMENLKVQEREIEITNMSSENRNVMSYMMAKEKVTDHEAQLRLVSN